ncbi:MAG: GHKL domain-containing protein [Lachnospiraceae bacterium]|nr:GHKL domain-containing protein [Lachnospiraceae bacterium]
MSIIEIIQNIIESFIYAFFTGQYIDVEKRKRKKYWILFTSLICIFITTLNLLMVYESFYAVFYSLAFCLFMIKFKNPINPVPIVNIVIYVLIWNIITSISSELAIVLVAWHSRLMPADLLSSDIMVNLYYIAKPICAILLYSINTLTRKYKYYQSDYSTFFIIIFLLLFVTITINETHIFMLAANMFELIFINTVLFAVVLSSYYIFYRSSYEEFIKREKNELNQQLKSVKLNLQTYEADEKKLKSMKHDLKNQFIILQEYLNLGEVEKCRKIIENSLQEIDKTSYTIFSGYTAIDAIISTKLSFARSIGIKTSAVLALSDISQSIEYDIAIIMGNLLDNAIENIKETEKIISLEVRQEEKRINILLKNTTDKKELSAASTKRDRDEHGFGLKNIEKIASIHNGVCTFEIIDNTFISLITIYDI